MKTSQNGLSLIKQSEGLELKAYLCPAGVPTIGYGCTKGVKLGTTITKAQAETMLDLEVQEIEHSLSKAVTVPLTQGQHDALVSFVFNLGIGNLKASTLLKKLNAKDYTGAADELLKWDKATVTVKDANGKVVKDAMGFPLKRKEALPGLTTRRKAERDLFLKK